MNKKIIVKAKLYGQSLVFRIDSSLREAYDIEEGDILELEILHINRENREKREEDGEINIE